MGLIKTAIYGGAAYAMFNSATKAYGERNRAEYNQQRQPQPQQMQFQQQSRQRSVSPSGFDSGYEHQHYCNGQCGEQCNPNASINASQYNNGNQQRRIEQEPEQLPVYSNSKMNKKDIGDLASMAQQFLRK
jgi:hypothetical protein